MHASNDQISTSAPALPLYPPVHNRASLRAWLARPAFQRTIIAVILVNAAILGADTFASWHESYGTWLNWADQACLVVFIIELALKVYAYGRQFVKDPWNVFDAIIVGIALAPGSGSLSVLRALRVLRVFRLVSAFPQMRFVVESLLRAMPGMASIGALLAVLFYVAGVMSATLFGQTHPEWFGGLDKSLYTLFQIMTLESWSMGIVRPIMDEHPWAWAFFVPFILLSSFTVLNLFIAVIVDSMQNMQAGDHTTDAAEKHTTNQTDQSPNIATAPTADSDVTLAQLYAEVRALRTELAHKNSQ